MLNGIIEIVGSSDYSKSVNLNQVGHITAIFKKKSHLIARLFTHTSCYICTYALIYVNNREYGGFIKLLNQVRKKIV